MVGEAGVGIGSGGFVAEQPALQISYRNAKKKKRQKLAGDTPVVLSCCF